jgi:hypothetical protein
MMQDGMKWGVTMRGKAAAISVVFSGFFSLLVTGAEAQSAPQRMQVAQSSQSLENEPSAQIRRPPRRVRIYPRYRAAPDDAYPRYFPGRNAVRECKANYVQEYRPSGPVIVPHMNCFWRRG